MTTDAAHDRGAWPLKRYLRAVLGSPARYAVAPAVVGLATGLQYVLWRKPVVPFAVFYLAVAATAAVAGRGPGLVAAVLGAAAGYY